jgi:hypothetical protein
MVSCHGLQGRIWRDDQLDLALVITASQVCKAVHFDARSHSVMSYSAQ